jgi:glutathione S-transferase
MMAEISNAILIAFPPSLDSELARFLLELYQIDYQEKPHTLIFCPFATLRHAGTVIFPSLYGDSFKLVGPKPMMDYLDYRTPHLRLYPQDTTERSQVESDWVLFNQTLAVATAKFAYYHLLPYREIMVRPLSLGTPNFEARTVEMAYGVYAGILRTLLGLTAQKAQQSLDEIRKVFDAVEARLAIQKLPGWQPANTIGCRVRCRGSAYGFAAGLWRPTSFF